jgi:hypothetical protein
VPHVVRFYDKLKNLVLCDRDTTSAKFKDISGQLPASLLDNSAEIRELWWMNQELLELRWRLTVDQKMSAVHGTLCTIPLHNSKQYEGVKKRVASYNSRERRVC